MMEIRSDLMDAHLYAFKRTILQDVLEQKEAYRSIRLEVLPYLVRSQLEYLTVVNMNRDQLHQVAVEHQLTKLRVVPFSPVVIGEVSHLSGYSFSAQNNIIHPSSVLGSKTTIGPHCILAEGSQLGDKCSVKRSVIGRHCRIGSNVKIVNSVVMNHVVIEDGCHIQGSVVCNNVQLQERAVLKDCQVGAGYIVTAGSEHKAESLARKYSEL
ncbi:transferase [Zea mays]|uniref:Transferase n=1 Tax=Zea mays TaxID=4577 RepID=A0A1D6KXW2_MAIZE|nr:transferase [Zea mays]